MLLTSLVMVVRANSFVSRSAIAAVTAGSAMRTLEKKRRSELRKRRRRAEVSKCNHEPGRKAASERGRASNERGRQAE
jgi:hypothetical protein